ncbi:MAG TPA: alpha/beta hydrolase [Streptosporangiaceae bacterium]|nr:alpha/beta hydrolase [Streptosporangiaceae bacterium]
MAALHDDADMAAQLERTLIGAYAGAADLGEAMATAGRVAPGDYGEWYREWAHTAEVALAAAQDAAAAGHGPMAARGYLRSAEYWRQAYFFLRHDLADERVRTGYRRQREAFRKAGPFLPFTVEAVAIPFRPVPMPGYVFRPASGGPRPTVLFTGGFDGTAEELIKYGVRAALEAGWNAVAWDGPGQGGMLVEHGVTMRPDFEAVLAPVVDWTLAQPGLADPARLMLVGRSLGGYLAPRGASGEPRIAALVCDPGQYDFTSRFRSMFTDDDWQKVLDADPALDASLQGLLSQPRDREFYGARMAAMGAATFGAWLRALTGYTLAGRAAKISCPTLITEGEGDFASQSRTLFDALTCAKQYRGFTASEGGGGHCEGMGQRLWEQAAFSWLSQVMAGG